MNVLFVIVFEIRINERINTSPSYLIIEPLCIGNGAYGLAMEPMHWCIFICNISMQKVLKICIRLA